MGWARWTAVAGFAFVALYIAACSVVTLLACMGMRDHTGADIEDAQYAHAAASPA